MHNAQHVHCDVPLPNRPHSAISSTAKMVEHGEKAAAPDGGIIGRVKVGDEGQTSLLNNWRSSWAWLSSYMYHNL